MIRTITCCTSCYESRSLACFLLFGGVNLLGVSWRSFLIVARFPLGENHNCWGKSNDYFSFLFEQERVWSFETLLQNKISPAVALENATDLHILSCFPLHLNCFFLISLELVKLRDT